MLRIGRRRAIAAGAGALLFLGGLGVLGANTAGAGTTNGDPVRFGKVNCTAHLSGGGTLSQAQDIDAQAVVPNQVNQGDIYTITIPGGSATLPHTGQGIPITQYTDLNNTYLFVASADSVTVTDAVAAGGATWNGTPQTFNVSHTATTVTLSTPGPLPTNGADGVLVTPDVTVTVTAPMADATVTSYVQEVDTTATLQGLGAVPVTCPIPHANPQTDGISATLVGAGGPTTSSQPACRPLGAGACPTTTTSTTHVSTSSSSSSTSTTMQAGPSFSVSDATVDRPDKGTAKMTFTVTLSQASASRTSVKYETMDGSAVSPTDYKHKKGSLSFGKGQTSKTITISGIKGGLVGQPDKTFSVVLNTAKGATISDGTGVGTIVDHHAPGLSVGDVSIPRPAKGTKTVTVTLSLTKPAAADQKVKVTYATADGTAHSKVDYNAKHGSVTFKKGATTATIKIGVKASSTTGNATFHVHISSATSVIIVDNDGIVTITGEVFPEGAFTVRLSGGAAAPSRSGANPVSAGVIVCEPYAAERSRLRVLRQRQAGARPHLRFLV